jgi:hypothetical protein
MQTPAGAVIDVYNTHLEAGPSPESIETRRLQLEMIAEGIERKSTRRAVIVLGDFNSAFARPGDREVIMGFRRGLGLLDAGAGPELPIWRERDFILYRNGALGTLSKQPRRRGSPAEGGAEHHPRSPALPRHSRAEVRS